MIDAHVDRGMARTLRQISEGLLLLQHTIDEAATGLAVIGLGYQVPFGQKDGFLSCRLKPTL